MRRIKKYLTPDKVKVLCNVFVNSRFSYASIIWMFCRKTGYLKLEKFQYKVLKIVFDSNEFFEDLILHSNEVSMHQKLLRQFTTKICKSLKDLGPKFIELFFTVTEISYNLRNRYILNQQLARTVYYGTNSVLFRACQLWNNLSFSIKQSQSFLKVKTNLVFLSLDYIF